MPRLIQARRELVHDRGETSGVIADRLVDQEKAARAALSDEAAHLVEPGDEARGLRAGPLLPEALPPSRVRIRACDDIGLALTARQLRDRRVAAVLDESDAELLEHGLDAPGVEDGGLVGVVAVAVPRPGGQVQCVPRPPIDALPVDLGPATARLDELDRIPGVAVDRRRRVRRELVDSRVEVLRRPVAVVAGVHATADAPARHVVHDDIASLLDGLVIALPLVQERLAPLLLDLVVSGLRGRGRLHRAVAPARAPLTCGSTSRASVLIWSR